MSRIQSIAILLHERDRNAPALPYRIWSIVKTWERRGIRVATVWGIDRRIEADLLVPHVDLSCIPDDYWAFIQQHPNVVNRNVRDIRKRRFSTNLVTRDDEWTGPVIVKTDNNSLGVMEQRLLRTKRSLVERIDDRLQRYRWWEMRALGRASTLRRYIILPSKTRVPRGVWANPNLIVERFLPERRGDQYCIRFWTFFGDRDQGAMFMGPDSLVKAGNATKLDLDEPPPELLVRERERHRLEYAKMDYVVHNGEPVLLDINRTPYLGGPTDERRIRLSAHLADGIGFYERDR